MRRRRVLIEEDDTTDEKPQKGHSLIQLETRDVIVPFGPRLVASETLLANPEDMFYAGLENYGAQNNPLSAVQALIHAGGVVAARAEDPVLGEYTTLPVAPSNTAAQGSLLLYNLYALMNANTPAGTELSVGLWKHYRESLSRFLGQRLPRFQNNLRKLDNHIGFYPWSRILSYADTLIDKGEVMTVPTDREVAVYIETSHWNRWLVHSKLPEEASNHYKPGTYDWEKRRRALTIVDELPGVHARDTALINLMDIASAQPDVLGAGRQLPATLTGGAVGAKGSSILERMLRAYDAFATSIHRGDTAMTASARQYMFLCVWLPLRTGIGFDPALGIFRPRAITFSLVGRTGILPLVAASLFATGDVGSDRMTFSLANELVAFFNMMQPADGARVSEVDTARNFLRSIPPFAVRKWARANHDVRAFYQAEHPLLDRLMAAALAHVRAEPRLPTEAPWFDHYIRSVLRPDGSLALVASQRTRDDAFALYQVAAQRIGAPDADVIVPDTEYVIGDETTTRRAPAINYAEFGVPGIYDLLSSLVATRGPHLVLFLGPALGRLPAMLAYTHPDVYCACVPTSSIGLLSDGSLHARATDWITPIVAQMQEISHDNTLSQRVFVMHDYVLSETYLRGTDILRHAREHLPASVGTPSVLIVANSYNAAVQFDVPELLFGKYVGTVAAAIGPAHLVSTVRTHEPGEVEIPLAVSSIPLAPLLNQLGLDISSIFYTGSMAYAAIPVRTNRSLTLRRALLRSIGVGGAVNPLYAELRDALADANTMLDAAAAGASIAVHISEQLVRIMVLARSVERLRVKSLLRDTPPVDIANGLSTLIRKAAGMPNVDHGLVKLVSQQVSAGVGAVAEGELSQLGQMIRVADRERIRLPEVIIDSAAGAPDTTHISITGSLIPLKLALDRLDQARLADGTRCLDVIGRWSRALFDLALTAMDDYRERFIDYYTPDDIEHPGAARLSLEAATQASAKLDRAEEAVLEAWPALTACLLALVKKGDAGVEDDNESLQSAYGPALMCAHMINTTLFLTRRIVETMQTDLRAGRAVDFSHQEIPFLAWFGMRARAEQQTVARLADLIFKRHQWLLPTAVAARHATNDSTLSLNEQAKMAAKQTIELVFGDGHWKVFRREVMARRETLKSEAKKTRGNKVAATSAADKALRQKVKSETAAELDQFGRVVDAFTTLGRLFREQTDAMKLPLTFFVDSTPEYISDLDAIEARLKSLLVDKVSNFTTEVNALAAKAPKRAEDALAPGAGDKTAKDTMTQVLDKYIKLFQNLAYAYVSGGFQAVFQALSGTALNSDFLANLREEALKTEDVWKIPINFQPTDPELEMVFPELEPRMALVNWLTRLGEPGTTVLPTMALPGRPELVVTYEPFIDTDGITKVQRAFVVIAPPTASQMLSPALTRWLKTYRAAEEHRSLRLTIADLSQLGANHRIMMRVLSGDLGIDESTVDKLRAFYQAAVSRARLADTHEASTLNDLAIESDDYWLEKALGTVTEPRRLPEFVRRQLEDVTLAEVIRRNNFDNKKLLTSFLWTAYTNLHESKAGTPRYQEWHRHILVPVPLFDAIEDMSWSMHESHLLAAIGPVADEDVSVLEEVAIKRIKENTIYRTLLVSTLDTDVGDTDYKNIHEKASSLALARFWVFAEWYGTPESKEHAKEVWEDMLARRDPSSSAGVLFEQDVYSPVDARIMDTWIEVTLFAAVPSDAAPFMKEKDGELELLATFSRMLRYIRSAAGDQVRRYTQSLRSTFDSMLGRAQEDAKKQGLVDSQGVVASTPPTLSVIASEIDFIESFEAFVQERQALASTQRGIWQGAVVRLLETIGADTAPKTVAWWVRARAASWSQRLRMILPDLRNDPAWPELLRRIDDKLPTDVVSGKLVESSAMRTSANKIKKAWSVYTVSQEGKSVLARGSNAGADLLATAIADVDIGSASTAIDLAKRYARMPEARQLSLARSVYPGKRTLPPEGAAQVDEAQLEKEEESGVRVGPLLDLFSARFHDPVLRFGKRVLGDEDAQALEERLARELPTGEAHLLAQVAAGLSRHVQFVEAERNRAKARPTEAEGSLDTLRVYVDYLRDPDQNAADVEQIVATRLVNDSLLYGDLDSLKVGIYGAEVKATPMAVD